MATELVLLDNVEHLGKVGEKVSVKDGYARNFLLPQGLAVPASRAVVKQLEARKAIVEKKYQEELAAANELAAKISETSILSLCRVVMMKTSVSAQVILRNSKKKVSLLSALSNR